MTLGLRLATFGLALGVLTAMPGAPPARADDSAPRLYTEHCAACHGGDRFGAMGPALIPEALARLRKPAAVDTITNGQPATQMPAFGATLSAGQIAALADYLYTPLAQVPAWSMADIQASHIIHTPRDRLPAQPVFTSDPLNLFTVVEAGDHHVTILDGDRFEPLARFQSRFALHGGAKYSPDGRFVYLASRDGWVQMFDLHGLALVAEVRAGINTRNIAVSSDGRFVAVGNMLPHTLTLLDARDLAPVKVIAIEDGKGHSSRVSAVYTAPPRKSFIIALKDLPEIWEISTDEDSRPIYGGLVHSYEKGQEEAVGVQAGLFSIRRMKVDDLIDDFFFDLPYTNLMGASRDGAKGQVVNLIVGRPIAEIALPGMPHLGSGISWEWQGRRVMATPHLKEPVVSVIDTLDWKTIKRIAMPGPGFFLRGHENTPYAWADAYMGRERDIIPILDTRTLEIVRTLRPEPGKLAAHVEFTRDGRYALVSIMENDGALVVYDAATFEEVKRLPMRKPIGKYNVWNKINYSSGTSH